MESRAGAPTSCHVSSPCSPNPACRFPAPGSPAGSCASHTDRRGESDTQVIGGSRHRLRMLHGARSAYRRLWGANSNSTRNLSNSISHSTTALFTTIRHNWETAWRSSLATSRTTPPPTNSKGCWRATVASTASTYRSTLPAGRGDSASRPCPSPRMRPPLSRPSTATASRDGPCGSARLRTATADARATIVAGTPPPTPPPTSAATIRLSQRMHQPVMLVRLRPADSPTPGSAETRRRVRLRRAQPAPAAQRARWPRRPSPHPRGTAVRCALHHGPRHQRVAGPRLAVDPWRVRVAESAHLPRVRRRQGRRPTGELARRGGQPASPFTCRRAGPAHPSRATSCATRPSSSLSEPSSRSRSLPTASASLGYSPPTAHPPSKNWTASSPHSPCNSIDVPAAKDALMRQHHHRRGGSPVWCRIVIRTPHVVAHEHEIVDRLDVNRRAILTPAVRLRSIGYRADRRPTPAPNNRQGGKCHRRMEFCALQPFSRILCTPNNVVGALSGKQISNLISKDNKCQLLR